MIQLNQIFNKPFEFNESDKIMIFSDPWDELYIISYSSWLGEIFDDEVNKITEKLVQQGYDIDVDDFNKVHSRRYQPLILAWYGSFCELCSGEDSFTMELRNRFRLITYEDDRDDEQFGSIKISESEAFNSYLMRLNLK